MHWALELPERFMRERAALADLTGRVQWLTSKPWAFTKDTLLKVDLDLNVGEEAFTVELVYPELFPDTPAYIRPRDSDERWSFHQYGRGGVLCLEWGPDNWHPDVLGAELVESAYRLLLSEFTPAATASPVPSRHELTFGQERRLSKRRLLLTSHLQSFIASLASASHFTLATHRVCHETTWVMFVSEIVDSDGTKLLCSEVPSGISTYFPLFSFEGEGSLFKSDKFDAEVCVSTPREVVDSIRSAGFTEFSLPVPSDGNRAKYLVLLAGQHHTPRALVVDLSESGAVTEYDVIASDGSTQRRLPPEYSILNKQRVGLVGMGSVGSKVAISLARCGIRNFLLVDDDVMLMENVCRHQLDWASVGVNKVEGVKEALSLIASNLEVQIRTTRIAGQESASSASTALEALVACDLIIDATASAEVFVQLAASSDAQAAAVSVGRSVRRRHRCATAPKSSWAGPVATLHA